jgi:glycosyltransferase involved in cell wall biosynthesis
LLFINRFFYPDHSATSQLLTELTEDLVARGEHVTVITSRTNYQGGDKETPEREEYKGIQILRVSSTRLGRGRIWSRLADYLSFYVAAFWRALRAGKQDCLIVLSDPPLLSVLAMMVRVLTRTNTVCWLQDIYPEIAVRAGVISDGWLARLLRVISIGSLRAMDRTIVLGRCMEGHLLRGGVPGYRVVTIPNWADGREIQPVVRRDNPFIKANGLDGYFVVMYSGNFGVVHDMDTIIALARETRDLSQLRFCFIGEGVHKRKLIETSQREGWTHTLFLPYQPKETLQQSLSAGDLHLVSLRGDMAGLCVPSKIYGIMAAGRPMLFIGPEQSEAAALIRESACGFVVPPGDSGAAADAIRTCYHDRALCESQGRAARDYFVRYAHRPKATTQFWQVLNKVAA